MSAGRSVVVVGVQYVTGFQVMTQLVTDGQCRWVVGVVGTESPIKYCESAFVGKPNVKLYKGCATDRASLVEVCAKLHSDEIVPDLVLMYGEGHWDTKSFEVVSEATMLDWFRGAVLGPLNTIATFYSGMANLANPVIAFYSSGWEEQGSAGRASVSSARHALLGLVRCAREDFYHEKISVVAVRHRNRRTGGTFFEMDFPTFCKQLLALNKTHSGTSQVLG